MNISSLSASGRAQCALLRISILAAFIVLAVPAEASTPASPSFSRLKAFATKSTGPASPGSIRRMLASPKVLGICSGPPRGLVISPASHAFPSIVAGAGTSSQTFTVTNVGSLPVTIGSVFANDGNSCDQLSTMSSAGCSGQTLPPDGVCSVSVTFAPSAGSCTGPRSGSLIVFSDVAGSPVSASLTGTVLAGVPPPSPGINLSSNFHDFGNVYEATPTPPSTTVTISSVGTSPLTISSITSDSPSTFSVTPSPACSGPIAPGGNCTISITYTPTISASPNPESGLVTVNSNAGSRNITLSGTSIGPPGIVVDTIDFLRRDQGSASIDLPTTLTNYSAASTTPVTVNLAGLNASDFSIVSDLCTGVPVAASGGTCTMVIRFTPQAGFSATPLYSEATVDVQLGAGIVQGLLFGYSDPPPANVSISPPSHSYGPLTVASQSACVDFTLTNTDPVKTAVFYFSGPFSSNFVYCAPSALPCVSAPTFSVPEVLGPGASCKVGYRFIPSFVGPEADSLATYDSFRASFMAFANIDGVGTGPVIDIGPNPFVSFGSQVIGTPAAPQSLTVTNTGSSNLTLTATAIAGPNASDFSLSDSCAPYPRVLAPAASCSVGVGFTPSAAGSAFADLTITSDAIAGSGLVGLDGFGVAAPSPSADFFPMAIGLGSVPYLTPSVVKSFSFANTGSGPMTISSIVTTGTNASDFSVSSSCPLGPSTLAPNSCCTVSIVFTPSLGGTTQMPESAQVEVAHDGTGPATSPAIVPLTGNSIPPPSIAPRTVAFADTIVNDVSPSVRVVLTNTGTTNIVMGTVAVTGPFGIPTPPPGPGPAPVVNTCLPGTPIPIGGSCFVDLVFKPAAEGALAGSLLVPFSNGFGGPAVITLAGNGVPPFFPGIAVSADAVDFGSVVTQTTSTRRIVVTSTGNGPLDVLGVRTLQTMFTATTNCGRGIAPGAFCEVFVSCRPFTLARELGELYIDHNASGLSRRVSLSCTGVPLPIPKIEVSSTLVGLGVATLGATAPTAKFTIRSVGTSPLAVGNVVVEAPFAVSTDCPASLPQGEFCTATVSFTAAGPGPQVRDVSISSDDPARPIVRVALTGTGCRQQTAQNARRPGPINLCAP